MRAERGLAVDGVAYHAVVAWSSVSGLALCYFIALDGTVDGAIDRGDRLAVLEPGEDLAELSEERLIELLRAGASLTETERRIETPEGGYWLAQSVGPVWAEGVAAGLTGVLFTDLDGSGRRVRVAGGPIASLTEDELLGVWADSLRDSEFES